MPAPADVFLSLIVAVARNGVIGVDGQLPWDLPEDLAWFRRHTLNKPVIMGRKTWESLPKRPLPHRPNLVVSRTGLVGTEAGAVSYGTVEAAIIASRSLAAAMGHEEAFVIGGGDVFAAALPMASRIYRTEIDADFDGDVRFPKLKSAEWGEVYRERRPAHEKRPSFSFVILDRHAPPLL